MNSQKGFIAFIVVISVLALMLSVSLSMSALLLSRQKISENNIKSSQSYYTAESGIEDSLLRLKKNPQITELSYVINIGGTTADVVIPAGVFGSRAISSKGDNDDRIKRIQAVFSIDGEGVSFHYGAQVGEGGMTMNNGSRVKGSVFSNGNITGSGIIENDVVISGSAKRLEGIHILGNALLYNCKNSEIEGNLTYVSGGTLDGCTVHGTTTVRDDPIEPQALPITQEQIQGWKDEASANVINGNVNITNNGTRTLGPAKIVGSLNLSNGATLKITGTIYVTGTINSSNNSIIKLDSSYGALSGVILADGIINVSNNSSFSGSGQTGSYLLCLSTNVSSVAINVGNNANTAIFYASGGGIQLSNNMLAREITAYKITLSNNAVIQYEGGMANMFFSSGPSAGWSVSSWQEE